MKAKYWFQRKTNKIRLFLALVKFFIASRRASKSIKEIEGEEVDF